MTGFFHFMAVPFDRCGANLSVARSSVNLEAPRPANQLKADVSLLLIVCSVLCVLFGSPVRAKNSQPRFAVLVFSKTTGFRHDSIPYGITTIEALGAEHGFSVDSTEEAGRFTAAELARYQVVVFLCTTGDILDPDQKAAFEDFIRAGGGFAGIHSASDTEYQWAWYGRLVGAYFESHPQIQPAAVHIENPGHPSTKNLPAVWRRTDEWYNFRGNPRGAARVLATLDEATYSGGGTTGGDHPIAWCQEIDGG